MVSMGLGILGDPYTCFKRKFRWLIYIPDVSTAGTGITTNLLPPTKSMRPNLTFREIEAPHINETIYFPGKPDWKPLTVTLYDIVTNINPVWKWIKKMYNPSIGGYNYPLDQGFIKDRISLYMYNGCGEIIEIWNYEDCWIQSADFQDVDMSDNGLMYIDLTIRYSRAYLVE